MILITIVTGVYKPIYNWGAPHCIHRFTSPKTILLKEHLHPNSYRKHPNYIQQKYENKMAIRHLDPQKRLF